MEPSSLAATSSPPSSSSSSSSPSNALESSSFKESPLSPSTGYKQKREEEEEEEEIVTLLTLERQLPFRRISPRLAARWKCQQLRQQNADVNHDRKHEEEEFQLGEDNPDSEGQRQQPEGEIERKSKGRVFLLLKKIFEAKKTCILMYISLLTLILTLVGYVAPMAQHFKLHLPNSMLEPFARFFNVTVDVQSFLNSTFELN